MCDLSLYHQVEKCLVLCCGPLSVGGGDMNPRLTLKAKVAEAPIQTCAGGETPF